MRFQKRLILEWGKARAKAVLGRRGVRRGVRIVCHASGWVRLEPVEILAPGSGEVLLRTTLSAVSPGTERAQYNRLPNAAVTFPYTPGYSGVGTVLEIGRGMTSLLPGDRVAGQLPHASVAVVRADRCVRVPEEVGDAEAAFTTLGVIALQGVRKAGIRFGDRVAVLGRGALGLLAARVARTAGPSQVTIYGRDSASAHEGSREPPFDVILDVTGAPEAVAFGARIAAPGARVALIGSSRGASPPLPDGPSGLQPIEIRGAHARMQADRESLPGRWTFADEAELYLGWVAGRRLAPFEGAPEMLDPREAWLLYRRLGQGNPPVRAALFDWSRLPEPVRRRRSTFLPPGRVFREDPLPERMAGRIPRLSRARRWSDERGTTMNRKGEERARTIGIALVGCGEIALRNAQVLSESGATELLWAVDTDEALARDLAARWGGRPSAGIASALEDRRVDAVFICTPHHLHASLCQQAASAGKHVLVEKPMARNAEEAASMIEAARAAGIVLSTCYPMRFYTEVRAARSLAQSGALGRILGARIAEHVYRETSYWFGGNSGRSRSSWRARRETSGGGVLLMNLCHHLDSLLFVTGLRPERVYGEKNRCLVPGDVEDIVALTLRLTGGAIVSVDASTCAPGGGERAFQVWGTDGQFALDEPPRFLSLRQTPLGSSNEWTHLPRGGELQARRDFVRAFAAAVAGEAANPVTPEEALAVQALIDAAYRSADRQEVVDLSSGSPSSDHVASNR